MAVSIYNAFSQDTSLTVQDFEKKTSTKDNFFFKNKRWGKVQMCDFITWPPSYRAKVVRDYLPFYQLRRKQGCTESHADY